jgi:hypothetical protein
MRPDGPYEAVCTLWGCGFASRSERRSLWVLSVTGRDSGRPANHLKGSELKQAEGSWRVRDRKKGKMKDTGKSEKRRRGR